MKLCWPIFIDKRKAELEFIRRALPVLYLKNDSLICTKYVNWLPSSLLFSISVCGAGADRELN